MRKIFLLSLCLFASFSEVSATVMLKPSLQAQMVYQEKINKVNFASEKKMKNLMRLAEIRAKNQAKNTKIPSYSPSTPKPSTPPIPSVSSPSLAGTNTVQNVDIGRVRGAWFGWYNDYRKSL